MEKPTREILDEMVISEPHASSEQYGAWEDTVNILKDQLSKYPDVYVALEYSIPRINRRIDALVFCKGIIFILEFKCGMKNYCKETYEQVIDYAYDLHFFHELSKTKLLVPVELPTEAPDVSFEIIEDDRVIDAIPCNKNNISKAIDAVVQKYPNEQDFDVGEWLDADYRPTPTIIEAAQILYREHNVENIKKHDSTNLTDTIQTLNAVIKDCRENKKKAICFVTGVPGAGKTLVGLSLAIQNMDAGNEEHSAFLSGNAPLVKTLVEALTRDMTERERMPKYKAKAAAETFIQGIHKFRLNGILYPDRVPGEHVVIFDEAQRAWNQKKLRRFVTSGRSMIKYHIRDYQYSEPESLIMDMDRHDDWATIVCLVGGGQEIYDGEAGLSEWFHALRKFRDWDIYVTPQLSDREYVRDCKWGEMIEDLEIHEYNSLHLSVSMRSLRTDMLNNFVKSVLDRDIDAARDCYRKLGRKYPVVMTRNLEHAKDWVKEYSGDCDRYGMIVSSNTEHIMTSGEIDFDAPSWFLDDKTKPTSSFQFKYAASEFNVQGLELDYVVLQWGADFRSMNDNWEYYYWTRANWKYAGPIEYNPDGTENLSFKQLYLKNTYRVLMTRARKGMVIYIPKGSSYDRNDLPEFYDGVYQYLKSIGVEEIS